MRGRAHVVRELLGGVLRPARHQNTAGDPALGSFHDREAAAARVSRPSYWKYPVTSMTRCAVLPVDDPRKVEI